MRFNIKIFFLVLLVLFLTGCKKIENHVYEESWEDDVLVAQECGLSGLQCCMDNEDKCQYGLECCLGPEGSNANFCAEKCSYGTENNFCRPEDLGCGEGLVCYENFCVKCGEPGYPCCQGEIKCQNDNTKDGFFDCINGVCSLCGLNGMGPCASTGACMENHLLNNGNCYKCGDLNKPCCSKNDEVYCGEGLKCNLGFCEKDK